MFLSVKSRILLGFGLIMLMLMASTAVNVGLLSMVGSDFGAFRSALDHKAQAADMDLVMQKVRVRVNQWLRSMNPAFAKQADELLAQDSALVAKAAASAGGEKRKEVIGDIGRALTAYTESWGVVQGLYATEASIYEQRISKPAAGIQAELSRLRDDSQDMTVNRLVGQARDGFLAAESQAFRYRTSLKQADADQVAASIAASLAVLGQAANATTTPVGAEAIKLAAITLGQWQTAFNDAIDVARTRVARLQSWTNKEGEAMAVGANLLRSEEEAAADVAQSNVVDTISHSRLSIYIASGLILLASISLSLGVAFSITRPLARMTTALKRLAAGDRALQVPETSRRDEIGEMAQAAQIFKENAIEVERLKALQEAAQAEVTAGQRTMLNRMADSFEAKVGGLVHQLSSAASGLQGTAQSMSATAARADHQAATVSASAQDASAGVHSVAAAAEELTASIGEIARQVAQSSRISAKAVGDARQTDAIVGALAEAAQKIGQVVGLIANVAAQTNLLALNATIEAARAGDAGKGFAVVASEVKSLALQTTRATEEIGSQIEHIQTATASAVEAIRGISATIEEVGSIAAIIAAAVEEQGAATGEIARNVQRTAVSTQDVSNNVGGVTQAAKDTGDAADLVLTAARELSTQANNLTLEVNSFVAGVRAA